MFEVQIEEPRPKGEALARLSPSSRSLIRITGRAGPKTSSVTMRESSGTSTRIVGLMK